MTISELYKVLEQAVKEHPQGKVYMYHEGDYTEVRQGGLIYVGSEGDLIIDVD